jgi:CheY-like chemotaxis protein
VPRILVADDEVVITMQLEERLTAMGYQVVGRASSGEASIDMARRLRPDLVLMDIVMPGKLDGIDAARDIRAKLDIPVIFLTAYASDEFIQRAKVVEPYGYIVKPFQEQEIKAAIEVALHRKGLEQQLFKSEQALHSYTERLKILHDVEQAILATQSPEVIAEMVLRQIGQLVPCQWASVVDFDFKAQRVTVLADHINGETRVGIGAIVLPEAFAPIIAGLRQGKVNVVEDVLALSPHSAVIEALQAEGVRSLIHIPLTLQGEVIGVLCLGADSPAVFAPEHVEVGREVANLLAIGIRQARLYEQAQQHTAERKRLVNLMAEHEVRMTELTDVVRELRDQLQAAGMAFLADDPLAAGRGTWQQGETETW